MRHQVIPLFEGELNILNESGIVKYILNVFLTDLKKRKKNNSAYLIVI